jgi:hypothetical protein
VADASARHRIAAAGRARVARDGHHIDARASQWLRDVLSVPERAARPPARTRA